MVERNATYRFRQPEFAHLSPIEIQTEGWTNGIGTLIWRAGPALARYCEKWLVENYETLRTHKVLRVIELGAGTGISGMVFAKCFDELLQNASCDLDFEVTLTDLESVIPTLQQNVSATFGNDHLKALRLRVMPLLWGRDQQHQVAAIIPNAKCDIILAADVVYNPDYHQALSESLDELSRPGTVLLMALERRDMLEEDAFFEIFKLRWDYDLMEAIVGDEGEEVVVFRAIRK
ncbi:putative methyltransferase-domain-containing protein [Gaertneriomyces semiglobifer]|nr:putative methyltransferase-domain-containing protein [Gaertneriomyces semiglobifer]